MSRSWLVLVVALLVACGHRAAVQAELAPAAAVETIRARRVPFALQARFSVRMEGPGFTGATTGGLVLHRPGRLRLELLTPLSTPLVYVATDGTALHAYQWDQRVFYRGDDALAVLRQLTGGAVTGDDVIAILTGGLPLPGADVISVESDGRHELTVLLAAPALQGDARPTDFAEVQLRAQVDARSGLISSLSLVRPASDGEQVLATATYLDYMKDGRSRLPEELQVELPTLGWKIWLEFSEWDEMGQIPDVFGLAAPAGSTEKDLVTTLRQLAARRGSATAP